MTTSSYFALAPATFRSFLHSDCSSIASFFEIYVARK